MIKSEYLRFLQTLTTADTPNTVRKIANLILNNLDIIRPLSTHQGQRAKKIVKLAQEQWQHLSDEIFIKADTNWHQSVSINRLKKLQVGPFRGFARQEEFDLDSTIVLLYGPNGTGKSSFCEALECGLLGNVAEAENKRFKLDAYLKNAHVNRSVPPIIEALDTQGNICTIVANEAAYRFCFIEKTRIDNFSCIAAQLPAKQSELISTLFGLDSFSEFVNNFTAEIDDRYIDLEGIKGKQLAQKQEALVSDNHIADQNNEALVTLAQEETTLANQYKPNTTFSELIKLIGNTDTPGEIATLEAEIEQPVPKKVGLTVATLLSKKSQIERDQKTLIAKERELETLSTELSFKHLYSAVLALSEVNQNECPACKTPLNKVTNNPFLLATQELAKLAHLSQLEQERDQISNTLLKTIDTVYQMMKTVCEQLTSKHSLKIFFQQEFQSKLVWWNSLFTSKDGISIWEHLIEQIMHLEQKDLNIDKAQKEHIAKRNRLHQLRELQKQIIILQTRRQDTEEKLQKANDNITKFNEINKQLISEVAAEKIIVQKNQEIADAYTQFISRLLSYKDNLPCQLITDLGNKTVELYNSFNRHDSKKDLLNAIKLPLAQGQRIEIAFQTNPSRYFDALHILSEGHIRCLGLAILTAKNLKENCPILIFDDPINAIDDDHRESIRRTLFEDNFFTQKQIILTCHGEEFFKDVQNLLGAARMKQSKCFTFRPQIDENHILVDSDCTPRNYILAAETNLRHLEIRQALAKARQALEVLTKDKVWRYLNRYGNGNLSIKLHSPTSPIELRNLTEQLRSKLSDSEFTHSNKDKVLSPINQLLGVNGNSREWSYLNKGTHEETDRAEFDRTTVQTIIAALIQLDNALA
ncbi:MULTISPECIES: AAA family ATPase [unclassified Legionella]|uniref:AAA family ATPase n=1 Tax=unclassified Legionella TaxID=2622702 RepID=UPI003AF46DD4